MPHTPIELRILGALLEKEATTPDNYPLSLNALTAACNQLSNREPVMALSEIDVRNAVNALRQESLVRAIQPAGSKVMKFHHLLSEKLELESQDRAVLGVLLLRGPQTLGEIRARTARLAEFPSLADVQATIDGLAQRGLVAELPRRPGQKETRFAQLMGGPPSESAAAGPAAESMPGYGREGDGEAVDQQAGSRPPAPDRVAALETRIDELQRELSGLRAEFAAFRRQFESE